MQYYTNWYIDRCGSGRRQRAAAPTALPGMMAAFIASLVLCCNACFLTALVTNTDAKTLPVMVASQTGTPGTSWWSITAPSRAAALPLVVFGILLERFIIQGMAAGTVK